MARVLIVEDEPVVRMVMNRALSRAGHQVVEAMDVGDAREKSGYEVVVVDKNLPDGSGIDLCAELLRREPGLPVIVLTGYASDAAVRAALAAGVFDFLRKPLADVSELGDVVERAVRARRDGLTGRPLGHADGPVLLVNDGPRGDAVAAALAGAGVPVERARDEAPALRQVSSGRLRAAVVAGERGVTVAAILDAARAVAPRLPVYVLHVRGALDDVVLALRGGAAGYFIDVPASEVALRVREGRA